MKTKHKGNNSNSVVIIWVVLVALYWLVDSMFCYCTASHTFLDHLFFPDLTILYNRIIVICFLSISFSHTIQSTRNYKERIEEWKAYAENLKKKKRPYNGKLPFPKNNLA